MVYKIIRQPVQSSDLISIGYELKTHILEIEFNHNTVYQYFDVPMEIYKGLMSADSHGQFFHKYIKNKYQYIRIN